MFVKEIPSLIELFPNGKIIIRNPKELDPCFKEFKNMMICINSEVQAKKINCNKNSEQFIKNWDKCIYKSR